MFKVVVWEREGEKRSGDMNCVRLYGDSFKISEGDKEVWIEFERSGVVIEIEDMGR